MGAPEGRVQAKMTEVDAAMYIQRKFRKRSILYSEECLRALGLGMRDNDKKNDVKKKRWADMTDMIVHTLATKVEDRTATKLKLLRAFCEDLSVFPPGVSHIKQQTLCCRLMKCVKLKPREILFTDGSSGDEMFFVVKGSLRVVVRGRTVRTPKLGDLFCAQALYGQALRPATAAAGTQPCVLLTLSRGHYLRCAGTLWEETTTILRLPGHKRTQLQLNLLRAMLEDVPFYASLPMASAQLAVCRALTWERYESGEVICEEGDIGNHFYIIGAGEVDVSIEGNKVSALRASHDPMCAETEAADVADDESEITLTLTGSPRSATEGGAFGSISLTGQTKASRRRTATCAAGVSMQAATHSHYLRNHRRRLLQPMFCVSCDQPKSPHRISCRWRTPRKGTTPKLIDYNANDLQQ